MAFSFSTDFDGSVTESAITFSSDSPSKIDVFAVDEILIRITDVLVDGFVVAAK